MHNFYVDAGIVVAGTGVVFLETYQGICLEAVVDGRSPFASFADAAKSKETGHLFSRPLGLRSSMSLKVL